jgi:iron complex outermembrane recepter protein
MPKTMTVRTTIAAILAGLSMSAHAVADTARAIDVPAGELVAALESLAKQADIELVYQADQLRGIHTAGVSGTYESREAVSRLLEGTRLTIRTDDATGVMLVAPLEASPSVSSSSPATAGMKGTENALEKPKSFWSRLSLAQSDTAYPAQEGRGEMATGENEKEPQSPRKIELEEIVVTGTHIRGQVTTPGSKVIVIGRDEIDRSGYATVQEVLRALPQNFSGGTTEINSQESGGFNLNAGTALNLRGLGSTATLVLVNGRRQPAGGLNGAFVDISSIALPAIDHIDVLADGASAIYGADAVGGVVNFVMRNDYEGAETTARFGSLTGDASEQQASQLFGTTWNGGNTILGYQYYRRSALALRDRPYTASDDLTRFGGSDFRRFYSNPGNILDPSTFEPAFAIPAGQDGTALTPADLIPGATRYSNRSAYGDLLPEQTLHSAFFSLTQALTERVSAFAKGRFGLRETSMQDMGLAGEIFVPSTNPFFVDPFGGQSVCYRRI